MVGMKGFVIMLILQTMTKCIGTWATLSSSASTANPVVSSSSTALYSSSTVNILNASLSFDNITTSVHESALTQATQVTQDLPTLSIAAIQSDATITMDLPHSILTPVQNILTSAQDNPIVTSLEPSSTQTSVSVSMSVMEEPCTKMKWVKPEKCSSLSCVKDAVADTDALLRCENGGKLKKDAAREKAGKMMISEIIQTLGMTAGQMLMLTAESNPHSSSSVMYTSDNIEMSAGFLDGQKYNSSNYNSNHVTIPMLVNVSDVVQCNVEDIPKGNKSLYVWATFKNLQTHVPSSRIEMDMKFIRETPLSELRVVEDKLVSVKTQPDMELNSDILLFDMEPRPVMLKQPIIITLKHHMVEERPGVKCVYWDYSHKLWSSEGIETNSTNSTHSICSSRYLGNFAVIVKIPQHQLHSLDNKMIVTLASVLGSLSTVALVACIAVIVLVGYYNTDRMKIYINLDIALIVGHLVFFIGLSASEDVTLCSNIATILHFCEVAALSWMFMEAIYIYDSLNNIFNTNNINPFFFYLAFGWGLPAAFAGSCSGYPFGDSQSHEFCWLFVKGKDIWYFAAPTLILVLMNIAIRVIIYLNISKTYPDDPIREKVIYALQAAAILLPVFILTWVFGVIAVNASSTKAFHYLFIVFHTMQGLLIFVFHCAKNKDIWQFYKDKKLQEEKKANAVLQFTYVP